MNLTDKTLCNFTGIGMPLCLTHKDGAFKSEFSPLFFPPLYFYTTCESWEYERWLTLCRISPLPFVMVVAVVDSLGLLFEQFLVWFFL